MEKQRMTWVDQLRALAMALVILGHACPGVKWLFTWTSPVKIPLFFVLSGYLFRSAGYESFGKFAAAKAKRLMVPYIALSAICQTIAACADVLTGESLSQAAGRFMDILTGDTMWFVPCLFIVEICLYAISRLSPRIQIWVSVLVFLTGAILTHFFEPLPWRPGTALFMTGFARMGMELRKLDAKGHPRRRLCVAAISGVIFVCCVLLQNRFGAINVNRGTWPCMPLNVVSCAAGCVFLMTVFPLLPEIRPAAWVGRNTMALYAFHTLALSAMRFVLKAAGVKGINKSFVWGIVLTICASAVCAAASVIINRLCPAILGNKKVVS